MFQTILKTKVLLRALIISLIVGILLAAINYGACLTMGTMTASCWIKVSITFFVPFFVSIISSALATNSEKSVQRDAPLEIVKLIVRVFENKENCEMFSAILKKNGHSFQVRMIKLDSEQLLIRISLMYYWYYGSLKVRKLTFI